MSPDLQRDLEAAVNGLLYPSETDAEFELVELTAPFPWDSGPDSSPSEVIPVRQFFAELAAGPDAAGFHALRQVLELHLPDLTVHRVGEINIDIYLTGLDRADKTGRAKENRVGVKTHAVET